MGPFAPHKPGKIFQNLCDKNPRHISADWRDLQKVLCFKCSGRLPSCRSSRAASSFGRMDLFWAPFRPLFGDWERRSTVVIVIVAIVVSLSLLSSLLSSLLFSLLSSLLYLGRYGDGLSCCSSGHLSSCPGLSKRCPTKHTHTHTHTHTHAPLQEQHFHFFYLLHPLLWAIRCLPGWERWFFVSSFPPARPK